MEEKKLQTRQEMFLKPNYKVTIMPRNKVKLFAEKMGGLRKFCRWLRTFNMSFRDCRVFKGHNIVPNVLRYELASLIAGVTVVPTFKSNYVALGSDATTAVDTDTKLGTELVRGTFTNQEADRNIAYLDKFFDSYEVAGNSYKEIGVFVDGTSSVDTGYLLSRINIDETLASNETIIVNISFTIT